MTDLLVRGCVVGDDAGSVDVRVRGGVVVEMGTGLRADGEPQLAGGGGALVAGLHDHHLHLLALAADLTSVRCGPPEVRDAHQLRAALRAAAATGDVRGTGYHESVAGPLDRDVLDAAVTDRPVRVQHRSGAAWFLNSAALDGAGLVSSADPAVERDADGRPTGRLLRGDHLLRRCAGELPDLRPVGAALAGLGVTGVTDATPRLDERHRAGLQAAATDGALPQRLWLLGAPLDDPASAGVPWKIGLDESAGLDLAAVADEIATAHAAGRPVAVHCVTRAEVVVTVTALREVGARTGDRVEHGSVLPRDLDADLARLGVTVVTQPHFVAERGDDYLRDVDPSDRDDLYRCGSLLAAGVAVAAGTDAPYGRPDPWRAIAAAVTRRTATGRGLGLDETLSPRRALGLFLGEPLAPGGPARRVVVGAPADLCLLRGPLDAVLADVVADPDADPVAATVVGGAIVAHPGG